MKNSKPLLKSSLVLFFLFFGLFSTAMAQLETPIILGSQYADPDNQLYSVSNIDPSASYTWEARIGANNLNGEGTEATIDFYPDGGEISFTATFENESATGTMQVAATCTGITIPTINTSQLGTLAQLSGYLNGTTLSTNTPSPNCNTSTYLLLNGTLTVDNNFTFSNLNLIMMPHARIIINNLKQLHILSSYLHGCATTSMWSNITITGSDVTLLEVQNSTIEDGEQAIISENGGNYIIRNSMLNKNNWSLYVKPYTGVHPGTIWSSTITCIVNCNGNTTPTTLMFPYTNKKPQYGFFIDGNAGGVTIGDINNLSNKNYFSYLSQGIHAEKSNTTIYNNDFHEIHNFNQPPYKNNDGTVIYSNGINATLPYTSLTVGGTGTIKPNTITSSDVGVLTTNFVNTYVKYNTFRNISTLCENIFSNEAPNIQIEYNSHEDYLNATRVFNCISPTIKIRYNDYSLNVPYNHVLGYNQNAISVTNPSTSTAINHATIYHNHILNAVNSIITSNLNTSAISTNTIEYNFSDNTFNLSPTIFRGIWSTNCNNASVQYNFAHWLNFQIPVCSTAFKLRGIQLNACTRNTILSNTFQEVGWGAYVVGNCTATNFFCNNFYESRIAIELLSATLPTQGNINDTWDNVFNNTFGSCTALKVEGTLSGLQPIDWYFQGDILAINLFAPYEYSGSNPQGTSGILHLWPFQNYNGACTQVAGPEPDDAERLADNAEGNVNYIDYPDENIYIGKEITYKTLDQNPDLMNQGTTTDLLLQGFYDENKNGNMGAFDDVQSNIESGQIVDAALVNASISDENSIELNKKQVYDIYLRSYAVGIDPLPTDAIALENIAYQNALQGGAGVYWARAILGLLIDDGASGSRVTNHTNINTAPVVQPVLTQDALTHELRIENLGDIKSNSILTVYNLLGEKIIKYNLTPGITSQKIESQLLQQGLYSYSINSNDAIIRSGKLVVIK